MILTCLYKELSKYTNTREGIHTHTHTALIAGVLKHTNKRERINDALHLSTLMCINTQTFQAIVIWWHYVHYVEQQDIQDIHTNISGQWNIHM